MADDAHRDRLESLRQGAGNFHPQTPSEASVHGSETRRANGFQRGIDLIERNTAAIRALEERSNRDLSHHAHVSAQLEAIMSKTRKAALKLKKWLDNEETKVAAFEADPNAGTTNTQFRRTQLRTNTKKFQDAMMEFGHVSEHFRDTLRQRVERQARVANIDTNRLRSSTDRFEDAVQRNEHLAQAVQDINEQRDEMLLLEEGVRDLAELFQDMALLVDVQQENLDRIDSNIVAAKERAETGRRNIDDALMYQTRARRRKFCVFFIIAIVFVIAVFIILKIMHWL